MIHFTGCTSPAPVLPGPSPHQGDRGFSLGVHVGTQKLEEQGLMLTVQRVAPPAEELIYVYCENTP